MPGLEDFGIAPVEAVTAGKPVIGFRAGGVTETVVGGTTGVFFDSPEVDSLTEAIDRLDRVPFEPAGIGARAEEFDTQVFRSKWRELIGRLGVDPALYSAR